MEPGELPGPVRKRAQVAGPEATQIHLGPGPFGSLDGGAEDRLGYASQGLPALLAVVRLRPAARTLAGRARLPGRLRLLAAAVGEIRSTGSMAAGCLALELGQQLGGAPHQLREQDDQRLALGRHGAAQVLEQGGAPLVLEGCDVQAGDTHQLGLRCRPLTQAWSWSCVEPQPGSRTGRASPTSG
jgi:hypothetical protein